MDNDFIFQVIEKLMADGKSDPKIRGWAMSDIVQEVENQLGKDASELARKHMISDYESEYKRLNPVGWAKSQRLFPNK